MSGLLELLREGAIRTVCAGKPFDATRSEDLAHLSSALGLANAPRQATQIHGDAIDLDGSLGSCDAFLVRAGQAALVRHADCYPVVVASPAMALAVVAHCGWKGVAMDLAGQAARLLVSRGAPASDLYAAIGPGIGPDSFEVGPEVLERFEVAFHRHTRWGTPSVDLPAVLSRQLQDAGVAANRVQDCGIDTFTDPKFHSHRRENGTAGRNATVCIVLPGNPSPTETHT